MIQKRIFYTDFNDASKNESLIPEENFFNTGRKLPKNSKGKYDIFKCLHIIANYMVFRSRDGDMAVIYNLYKKSDAKIDKEMNLF